MTGRRFSPGFRISTIDVVILAVGTLAAAALFERSRPLAFVVGFVVGHFFLFCNVFRISRMPEMIWAGAFSGCVAATVICGKPGWAITIAASLMLTGLLVALEMRKPSYHGVFWARVNPNLESWWSGKG